MLDRMIDRIRRALGLPQRRWPGVRTNQRNPRKTREILPSAYLIEKRDDGHTYIVPRRV